MKAKAVKAVKESAEMQKLLDGDVMTASVPKAGDLVTGTVVSANKKEVLLDVGGILSGVIRGKELFNESAEFAGLKPGAEVEATVLEVENERGMLELSFRFAGHQKTWAALADFKAKNSTASAHINDANKGGLLVTVNGVPGFLPVSQLSPEYYPRIQGGDKNKILERLKSYVGKNFGVKVIDIDEESERLIVSEKAAWEEAQKDVLGQFKVGDVVDGKITAVTDFGVFIEFGGKLEGLVHISELAWQRIEDPRSLFKVGDEMKAEIVKIDGSKIFLSSKKLSADPWANITDKYHKGDIVEGIVQKTSPYGLFVELDQDIHGLAHLSELSDKPVANVEEIAKVGDKLKFRIVSIEPAEHRLGLSIKALKEKEASSAEATAAEDEPKNEGTEEPKV